MRRELAAILFADVASYTRLMDLYEADTHPRWMALFEEVIEPAIAAAEGRVVKYTGDGFLARFASVVGAVQAAAAIQGEVHGREAGQPREKRIALRMGLHSGDIVSEARDVYGAGVNLAARLQEAAEPGSLLISRTVYDQLGSNLQLPVVDQGFLRFKNIRRPVRVYKIVTAPRQASATHPASPVPHTRPSIAVLPFAEFGAADDRGYFGDGIVEDITAALASLPDIFVISRASTLKYQRGAPDFQAIVEELGVRYVLWGSARRRGQRLRIAAELAEAETQTVIEEHRVEGDIGDLFGLQDSLVEAVVQKITPNAFAPANCAGSAASVRFEGLFGRK